MVSISATVVPLKAGLNKGVRRCWLEGRHLSDAGFVKGARYNVEFGPSSIMLTLHPDGKRAVSGKQKASGEWQPIIDITGAKVADSLGHSDDTFIPISVSFANGRIVVSPFWEKE